MAATMTQVILDAVEGLPADTPLNSVEGLDEEQKVEDVPRAREEVCPGVDFVGEAWQA